MPSLVDNATPSTGRNGADSCEMLYPMYVISAKEFVKLPRLLPHAELLQRGVLKKWSPKSPNKVILVSHQWLRYSEPDPENEHFSTLQRMLTKLMKCEVAKVDDWWLHKAVFQTKATSVGKSEWADADLWVDYSCMPQVGAGSHAKTVRSAAKAVESIPAYVERSDVLLVVAPVCRHKDSGELCNYGSWRGRGWCRMELMCSILARRKIRTLVCMGENAKPFLLHPCEGHRLVIGTGSFSCCKLGHNFNGVPMPCDKERVRSVLEVMLANKVAHARAVGNLVDSRFYASLRHAFLVDLPVNPSPDPSAVANARVRELMAEEQRACEAAGSALERVRARLRWGSEDEADAKVSGFTMMMCAALMDDAEAVRQLAAPAGGRAGELNVGLKKNFFHLSYMMKGATPLVTAMVYAGWETCEALLDVGADPKLQTFNGMDGLFSACCRGSLHNVAAFVRRFPSWEFDRTEPGMGLNPTCLSALVGSERVFPVLKTLMEAKASVSNSRFFGGSQSMLCLLASNENVNDEAARYLMSLGCDVGSAWRPQKLALQAMLKAARLAGRFPHCKAVDEFAVLDGSTPLHFAAKRGDVNLINLLVNARAEPVKNRQGHTPLDVARTFFGGCVPSLLESALSGEGARREQVARASPPQSLPVLLTGAEQSDPKDAEKQEAKSARRGEPVKVHAQTLPPVSGRAPPTLLTDAVQGDPKDSGKQGAQGTEQAEAMGEHAQTLPPFVSV